MTLPSALLTSRGGRGAHYGRAKGDKGSDDDGRAEREAVLGAMNRGAAVGLNWRIGRRAPSLCEASDSLSCLARRATFVEHRQTGVQLAGFVGAQRV